MTYEFRAYCDICKCQVGRWFDSVKGAQEFRIAHFEESHPDNPMKKENCRIQRRVSSAD